MSQADLAQQIGVSRQSVAKWEAEKSYPEMDKLIKICDIFGCGPEDLITVTAADARKRKTGTAPAPNVVDLDRTARPRRARVIDDDD